MYNLSNFKIACDGECALHWQACCPASRLLHVSVALGMGTAFVHVGCYGFLLGAQERQHC